MPRLYSGFTVSMLLFGVAAFAVFYDELAWEIRRLHRALRMRLRGGMIGNG